MPCVTYLSDNDHTKPTTDAELNSLLAEVRAKTGDDWRIAERTFVKRRWFRKPVTSKLYTLYHHVHGPEFQLINFYRPERANEPMSSLNVVNDASLVAAYLYGVLATQEAALPRET